MSDDEIERRVSWHDVRHRSLPLCVFAAFVAAKAEPVPCVSTAFVAKILPLPCGPTQVSRSGLSRSSKQTAAAAARRYLQSTHLQLIF